MNNVTVYIWVDPKDLTYLFEILKKLDDLYFPVVTWNPNDVQFSKTFVSNWMQIGLSHDLFVKFKTSVNSNGGKF